MFLLSQRDRDRLPRFARGVRRQLLWIFLSYGIASSLTWYYRVDIFAFLLAPAQGGLSSLDGRPVFISPTEMLGSTIQLALMGGAVGAVPVVMVGVFRLLSQALRPWERRSLFLFFPAILVSYTAGIAFAYFVLLPTGLRFLLSFGTDIATPTIRISEYLSLVTAMMLWLGLVFELPLVMFVVTKFRLVSFSRFWRLNKFVPVMAFVFSAIITPTVDVVSQSLVAIPLFALYEAGLFLSWMARPSAQRKSSICRRVLRKVWSVFVFVGVAVLLPALLIGMVAALLWYAGVFEIVMSATGGG